MRLLELQPVAPRGRRGLPNWEAPCTQPVRQQLVGAPANWPAPRPAPSSSAPEGSNWMREAARPNSLQSAAAAAAAPCSERDGRARARSCYQLLSLAVCSSNSQPEMDQNCRHPSRSLRLAGLLKISPLSSPSRPIVFGRKQRDSSRDKAAKRLTGSAGACASGGGGGAVSDSKGQLRPPFITSHFG